MISIHSSHTGRDRQGVGCTRSSGNFNPLFPYGKRPRDAYKRQEAQKFQSTLPIREETLAAAGAVAKGGFNPLFPYGKRPGETVTISTEGVSIHSSHTGRDKRSFPATRARRSFNPLFPYGKRPAAVQGRAVRYVSIHSSHTGRDSCDDVSRSSRRSFNPLFPYGKRPSAFLRRFVCQQFQSTLPIREETGMEIRRNPITGVSIHSSHTGRDVRLCPVHHAG